MPRNDDGYDDRPKKSWSEVDKARDGKRSGGSAAARGERARLEKSASYGRYKSAADAFFSGAALPDSLAERLDPTGEGRARKEALAKVKAADDDKAFAPLAKAYVEAHGLFEDPYLLDRLLTHPEAALVLQALEKIGELHGAGGFKAPPTLPQRLKSLQLLSGSRDVQAAAKALATALKGAPR